MTLDEFYEKLKSEVISDYIVCLRYKYDYEKTYTISNEILLFENNDYVWLNDWNEGQTDVKVLGYIAVDKIDIRGMING